MLISSTSSRRGSPHTALATHMVENMLSKTLVPAERDVYIVVEHFLTSYRAGRQHAQRLGISIEVDTTISTPAAR
jgi:hypothetical protein